MTALTKRGTVRKRDYPTERARRGETPWERVARHVAVDAVTECWVWQRATTPEGYAQLTIDGKPGNYAHRIAYEEFVGVIPDGLQIDHLCRNRACCNPSHLEPVTCQVNVLRGTSPGARARRRDACLYGHQYSEWGVIHAGRRSCRLCNLTYCALWRSTPTEERDARKAAGLPLVDLGAYFAEQAAA